MITTIRTKIQYIKGLEKMETMIYEIDTKNIKKNYNIAEINDFIAETTTRLEITKTGENKYYGADTSIDAFMLILGKKEWFVKNVKKWEITRHEENITDDVYEVYKEEGIIK